MNSLDDLIHNNVQYFDSEPIPERHELKFEKLLQHRLHNNSFVIKLSVAIAASVLIFVGISIYVYKIKTNGYSAITYANQSVEFTETEQYFSQQTNTAFNNLKTVLATQSDTVSKGLYHEINQMDLTYNQLRDELKNNPNDSRITGAIIQYYQMKLELINNLTERFTLYSNNKLKHHENEQI
jgi:hypothetical protein